MKNKLWFKAIILLLRIAVALVFLLSGFAKAIDPWGTVYKIGEYLSVWGWYVPRTLVVVAAFGLAIFEFVAGALMLLGAYKRAVPLLLLITMAVMLPLSGYIALNDPVSDCGCFGDLWVISNSATFWKNVLITGALVLLFLYNKKVPGLYPALVQWVALVLCGGYILAIALYGYNVQPLLDFRRFPVGTQLLAEENDADEPEYIFNYRNSQGEIKTFSQDSVPDGNDWTFVNRELISGSENVNDDFSIIDADGDDITREVINDSGEQIIISIPELAIMDVSHTFYINELADELSQRDADLTVLVAGGDKEISRYQDVSMSNYPVVSTEGTLLKELVRGNPGMVKLQDGEIVGKTVFGPGAILTTNPANVLKDLTWLLILALLVLMFISRIWLLRKLKKSPAMKQFNQIKQQFFMMRNGVIADTMRQAGMGYEMVFGLNIPQLREIAKETGPNHELALLLFNDRRCRESMLLAPMIMPPQDVSTAQALEMMQSCPTTEVMDVLCHSLLKNLPSVKEIIEKSASSKDDMMRYGALRLAFNVIDRYLDLNEALAKEEAQKDCPLTQGLCKKILNEVAFLKDEDSGE